MHDILTLFTWPSGNPAVSYELLGPVTDGQSVEGTCIFLVHQLLIKQELLKYYVVITLLFNKEHFSSLENVSSSKEKNIDNLNLNS